MSASTPGPQDAPDRPQSASERPGSPSDRTCDRTLMERVLRRTLQENDAGARLEDADQEALLQVTARYRNQPFSLEPIAVEMVSAVLQTHFQKLFDSAGFWRMVSAEIAQTLFDDPLARPRLEGLWHRLCRVDR